MTFLAEVQEAVALLAEQVRSHRGPLSPTAISLSLYGLQRMSNFTPPGSGASDKQPACHGGGPSHGPDHGRSHGEVSGLVGALLNKLQADAPALDTMSPRAIGNCLYGLQNMRAEPAWVPTILRWLALLRKYVSRGGDKGNDVNSDFRAQILSAYQCLRIISCAELRLPLLDR